MQAQRERITFLLLPSLRKGYASGRQKDRDKRERGKADVNGSRGTIPRRDITVQTAEPPSLPKIKRENQLS